MLMRGFRIDIHLQNTFDDDHSNKTQIATKLVKRTFSLFSLLSSRSQPTA